MAKEYPKSDRSENSPAEEKAPEIITWLLSRARALSLGETEATNWVKKKVEESQKLDLGEDIAGWVSRQELDAGDQNPLASGGETKADEWAPLKQILESGREVGLKGQELVDAADDHLTGNN